LLMNPAPSQQALKEMVWRWLPSYATPERFRIHTDISDFFNVDYNDIVVLKQRPYLIRHNTREGRFGLDDEVKFWVKRAVDLEDGSRKIMKFVFYERFTATIGGIAFECFRSPKKEARILKLVAGRKNFMHGDSFQDEKENIIRVLDFIQGNTIASQVENLPGDHETYYHKLFPEILDNFIDCVRAIRFLHENGERHGDIRRDHILIDRQTGDYRWIDFDFNYRHRENIYGYDLFGLGNILVFLAGKGDVLLPELKNRGDPILDTLCEADLNIVFRNRVVNLKKIYPYISEPLNRVLRHFSRAAHWYYEHTDQLLADLEEAKSTH